MMLRVMFGLVVSKVFSRDWNCYRRTLAFKEILVTVIELSRKSLSSFLTYHKYCLLDGSATSVLKHDSWLAMQDCKSSLVYQHWVWQVCHSCLKLLVLLSLGSENNLQIMIMIIQ